MLKLLGMLLSCILGIYGSYNGIEAGSLITKIKDHKYFYYEYS
jgi:hypothetical protein